MIQETGLQEREQDYRKGNRITGKETGLQEKKQDYRKGNRITGKRKENRMEK